jgi:hypothetical protein
MVGMSHAEMAWMHQQQRAAQDAQAEAEARRRIRTCFLLLLDGPIDEVVWTEDV